MVKAEYESTAALYAVAPNNVPEPWAYGCFAEDPNRFFYLQSFCDMRDTPSHDEDFVGKFVALLAQIHGKESPTGKFGFHITTYQGNISNNKQWCDTWEEYFSQNLRYVIDLERTIHGADPEMDDLSLALIEKIVPRLPRSRETGGNEIKPVLLNGDMWHGNVSADSMTGDPILYDPGSFYGHHEYDLAPRRAAKYQFGETHRSAYLKLVAASDPQEDCNDRNALYTL